MEKKSDLGQIIHFRPKKFPCSQLCIYCKHFFEILNNERDQEVHGNYINSCSEKTSHLGQLSHFGPKNGASSLLWVHSKDCFEILHNERGQEVHGTYINGFPD